MLKTLEELQAWKELQAWTATHLKRWRFVDGEDLKQLAQLIENIQHEVSADYVELPLDADGVPIRVGDVMEWPTTGKTFKVVSIGDGSTLFYIGDGKELADWTGASTKRHHHAPTAEDVLREFAEKITDSQIPDVHPTYEEALAEYAQRLQLREVDE